MTNYSDYNNSEVLFTKLLDYQVKKIELDKQA